jgi:murein DD-endopeptidase MepM/ murein hydrolase activator NlpD
MPQKKYIFHKENLRYQDYADNWKQRFKHLLPIIIIAILAGVAAYFLSSGLHFSYDEVHLRSQNSELMEQYARLSAHTTKLTKRLEEIELKDDSLYRSLLGTEPLDAAIRLAGTGGHVSRYKGKVSSVHEVAEKLEKLESRLIIEEKSLLKLEMLASKNKDRMRHLPAIMPVSCKDLTHIGSGYGMRFHPILRIRRMHWGQDFTAPRGSKIYATADAVVESTRYSTTFGRVVILDHGYQIKTYYAHLKAFNVKPGQKVKRGDVIGFEGSSGLSTGAHLHYEVRYQGRPVDPLNYVFKDLTAEEYEEVVRKASSYETSLD